MMLTSFIGCLLPIGGFNNTTMAHCDAVGWRRPPHRGQGGEIPFTALPGGSGRNFTWMLTAGIAIPIGNSIHLELSYRYTDAGEIRTDVGDGSRKPPYSFSSRIRPIRAAPASNTTPSGCSWPSTSLKTSSKASGAGSP